MTNTILIILFFVVVAFIIFAVLRLRKHKAVKKILREGIDEAYPIWAELGPHENGERSARALRAANLALKKREGPANVNVNEDYFELHQLQYDNDTEGWEKKREMLQKADIADKDKVSAALQILKQGLLEDMNKAFENMGGGHKIEFSLGDDGNTYVKKTQIWSDEKIKAENAETAQAVIYAKGQVLLENKTQAGINMMEFIAHIYREAEGNEITNPEDIGRIYFNALSYSTDNPDSEFGEDFRCLDDAYMESYGNGKQD